MNKITIENWMQLGKDYMFYAELVNPTNGEMRLNLLVQVTGNRLDIYGPDDRLEIFKKRLTKNKIQWTK